MSSLFERAGLEEFRELLEDLDDFIEMLPIRFNRMQFRRVRRQTGSQYEWALAAGVTQTTIGNWERGYTTPSRSYRRHLKGAAESMRAHLIQSLYRSPSSESPKIDIVATNKRLRHSILRAALTDFEFDPTENQIVPIPFRGDYQETNVDEIERDRANLFDSLQKQATIIVESIGDGANLNDTKFKRYIESYQAETQKLDPNPRLLNRFGTTISRISNSDDFRNAVSDYDMPAIDGFNQDHLELMRLYFREALAKAQELDSAEVTEVVNATDGAEFRRVADLMEQARTDAGESVIDPDIPTLLRDIANEIRDLDEAATFTSDESRRNVFRRRKSEAFKNGGVYVGRFVFFSALVSSLAIPGAGEVLGTIGAIVGITETFAPGTIRNQYEQLREKFPGLPNLPSTESGSSTDDGSENR